MSPEPTDTGTMTDAQLLAGYVARGSQEAFARIVRRYSPLVYGTCRRVLGEAHEAEDALQATFMVLARRASRLTAEVVLGDWLFRTARNCAMNLAKARCRRARHEREAAMEASRKQYQETSAGLWHRVSPLLDAALAGLPRRQREAASLYYCAGMSQTRIAREVGVTQKAVSKRLGDALRGLRRALERQGVTVPGATLGALLLERAAQAVPEGLVESVVAGCTGAAAVSAAAGQATRSVIRHMLWAKVKAAAMALGALTAVALAAAATGDAPAPAAGGPAVTVLGKETLFRRFLVYRTPVVVTADGKVSTALAPEWDARKSKEPPPLAEYQSPLPPADWRESSFDDVVWPRDGCPVEVEPGSATGKRKAARHSATRSSMICLRGKFHVDDPGKVRDLRLSLEYVGGVAVYLNGKEIRRGHLPEGKLAPETLAEKYPDDLYCLPGGKFLQREELDKNAALFDRRYRKMADVALDSKLLRKGENVLAIEILRAPVNAAACDAEIRPIGGMTRVQGIWAYAGLKSLTLTAGPGSAVRPNNGRPEGIQVWNCLPFDTVTSSSWGDTGDRLKPIRVPALPNGVFSGRLVISSGAPIKGLKASVTDFKSEAGGSIPASAAAVRCAAPAEAGKCWVPLGRYDALPDELPSELPVVSAPVVSRGPAVPTGAVAALWITVRVPAEAAPGTYRGTVSVEAQGLPRTEVPMDLVVHGWRLPDPKDFRVHNLADFSPENLAMYYGVPFWSERHFELMVQSMKLMAEVGNRQAEIDLAIDYHGAPNGNSESVVRWIKQPDGSYKHDFSVFEKFLGAVAAGIERPRPLRLNCWGVVQKGALQSVWAKYVSVQDPATGKLDKLEQPLPGSAESLAFWKPVIDAARERIRKRGWEDLTSMGHQSYCWLPTPEMVDVCHKIWPEAVWSFTAHNGTLSAVWKGTDGTSMPVRYSECVWTQGAIEPRGYRRLFARKDKLAIWNSVARNWHRDWLPIVRMRHLPEDMIMRGHDGVGQLGVDLFPVKDARGRYYHLNKGRGGLGPECSTRALLAPGPKGPIGTERYEMFREGVQLCEAILFLQGALEEKKIDGELAAKVEACLDARGTAYVNDWWEGQFPRDEQLFALVGEVAGKVSGTSSKAK